MEAIVIIILVAVITVTVIIPAIAWLFGKDEL